jgi:Fe-Mn family superoxide dismutase
MKLAVLLAAACLACGAAALRQVELPALPYRDDHLEPHISAETVRLHYGKHQAGYVNKLNELMADVPDDAFHVQPGSSLVSEVIKMMQPKDGFHKLASQIYNHALYFAMLSSEEAALPMASLPLSAAGDERLTFGDTILRDFESYAKLQGRMNIDAMSHFGSGWVWLVLNKASGKLEIVATHDGGCPLLVDDSVIPLLVCDVWEHAYYVDYRNERPRYIKAWAKLVDWAKVERRFDEGTIEKPASARGQRGYPEF